MALTKITDKQVTDLWSMNVLNGDPTQETALWMFSPRLKRIKNVIGT